MLKQQGKEATAAMAAALYCRLSRDDEIGGDSSSIQTQKAMLSRYAQENGYDNFAFYVDDGFTGVNFKRDDFQRLMGDIEDGKIGCVITKDLSRLGRNYLEAGRYRELFSEYGVRFIAISDGYDSFNDDGSDIATPIKEIIHEFYARDCSARIKSALKTKAQNGGFITGRPAYGYSRVEGSTNRIAPDENAPTVKRIFRMSLEGKNCSQIAKILESEKILVPRAHKIQKYGDYADLPLKYPYGWGRLTVNRILVNPIYTGKIVNLRTASKSFKDKRKFSRPEDEWVTTAGTHEPLVSQEVFDTVQKRVKSRQRAKTENPENIFRSLVFCSDCSTRMAFQHRADGNRINRNYFRCARNVKYGNDDCASHYINAGHLEAVVLSDIQKHASLAADNTSEYVRHLTNVSERERDGEKASFKKEAEKCKKRSAEIDAIIQKMYEDKVFGIISNERFVTMKENLENEQQTLKGRYSELSGYLNSGVRKGRAVKDFAELVRKYTDITELDSELVHTLIDRIVVYEREKIDGEYLVRVDIYYRFVGIIDGSGENTAPVRNCRKDTD
jgi:DNA invertase Pin-like site-specific DNA recombinase